MDKVLVTGGAGFLGSNLVAMLLKQHNCEVTVLDNLFTGKKENLANLGVLQDVEFIEASVANKDAVATALYGKDTVFHLATINIIASMNDPRLDLENIIGSFNIFDGALKNGVKKIIYASSSSVYGNSVHLPIKEDSMPDFFNFYSVGKYAGEAYASVFYKQYNLPITCIRYTNIYGINQRPDNSYCGVVSKFINAALKGEKIIVYGNGSQTRDFTYVEDACRGTIRACLNNFDGIVTYNIGTGVETSVLELAEIILRYIPSLSKIIFEEKRPIDNINRRVLSIDKAYHELQYSPNWNLVDGLKHTIDWMQNSKE
jgi:UDP-glucose 4-epimerase